MKLSELELDDSKVVDGDCFGVDLDMYCTECPKGLSRISFNVDLNEDRTVSSEFMPKLAIWGVAMHTWGVETFIEIPHDAKVDFESLIYGLSALGMTPVIVPSEKGAGNTEAFFDRARQIAEWSFIKNMPCPLHPSAAVLSNLMAASYSGLEVDIDSYTKKTFGGERFENVLDGLLEIQREMISTYIGDDTAFRGFSVGLIDQVAVKIKDLLVTDMIAVKENE